MVEHRNKFKQWKTGVKTGTTSYILFDKYGIDTCNIILLETVNCNSRDELRSREAHYIKTLKCVNKHIPNRTNNEWRSDNKEQNKCRRQQYYEANKEEIITKSQEYKNENRIDINKKKKENRFTCDCGSEIRIADRCKHFKTGKHLAFLEKNKIV